MAKKISTKQFAEELNNEGLDYAINFYFEYEDLADPKLAQLVKAAKDSSNAVLDYLNEVVPGWDGLDELWNSEEMLEQDIESPNFDYGDDDEVVKI